MNFITKLYWLGFIGVAAVLWILPARLRKPWLLLTSFAFYAVWSVPYCALLFGAAAVNHFGAKWIVAGDRERRGKIVIAANLLVLGAFKYLAWVLGTFASVTTWLGLHVTIPIPKWALPLGISFYLFEAISYIFDLVRKREKIHSFWDFQLFIAFFPKLLAGPILRAKEFLPQLEADRLRLRPGDVRLALRQIAIGLFLKLLIADSIGGMIDSVFTRVASEGTALDAWIIGVGFSLQGYLDFSAYTRLAIGCARLCGVELVENFDHPMISTSPSEFWRRYHMSLSRWIRDYLFYPLAQPGPLKGARTRVKLVRRLILVRAAILSMTIFGLWHGASWTWFLYGLFAGLVLGIYNFVTDGGGQQKPAETPGGARAYLIPIAGWAFTMGTEFLGSMIARSTSVSEAFHLFSHALRPFAFPGRTIPDYILFRVLGLFATVVAIGYVARRRALKDPKRAHAMIEFGVLGSALEGVGLGILLVLAMLELTGRDATFIYFQF